MFTLRSLVSLHDAATHHHGGFAMILPRRGLIGLLLLVSLLVAIPAAPCSLPPRPAFAPPGQASMHHLTDVTWFYPDAERAWYVFWYQDEHGVEQSVYAYPEHCVLNQGQTPQTIVVLCLPPTGTSQKATPDDIANVDHVYILHTGHIKLPPERHRHH